MEPGRSGPGLESSPAASRPRSRLMMMKDRLRQQRQRIKKENESNSETSELSGVSGHHDTANRIQAAGPHFDKGSRMARSKTTELTLISAESKEAAGKRRSGLLKSKSLETKVKGSRCQKSLEQKSPASSSDENMCSVPNRRAPRSNQGGLPKSQSQRKMPEVRDGDSSAEWKREPESKIAKAPVLKVPGAGRARKSKLARPQTIGPPLVTAHTPRTVSPSSVGPSLSPAAVANKPQDPRRQQQQQQPEQIRILRRYPKLRDGQPRNISTCYAKFKVDHNANIRTMPHQELQAKLGDCDPEYSSSPRTDEALVVQNKTSPAMVPSPSPSPAPSPSVTPMPGRAAYSVGWVSRQEAVRSSSVEPDSEGCRLSRKEWHQRRQSRSLDNLAQESEELHQLAEHVPHVVSDETYIVSAKPAYGRSASAESLSSIGSGNGYSQKRIPENMVVAWAKHGLTQQDMYGQDMRREQLEQITEVQSNGTGGKVKGASVGKGTGGGRAVRPTGLRVTNPDDLKPQSQSTGGGTRANGDINMGRRQAATPRRHTVNVGGSVDYEMGSLRKDKDFTRQKAAFLDHLAEKYPEHAHVITGQSSAGYANKQQPGEASRRKTTQVTYNPDNNQSFVYDSDDMSVQSEANTSPTGQLRRGGRLRASLPVVRSPNKSMDKPMGLVFLILRNETKRALLPNEITSIDTVRALFVRSFPKQLSLPWFEVPGRKIYIQDPATNLYYELEDLRDIKNRTVLKIYEKERGDMQNSAVSPSPLNAAHPTGYHPAGYESDSSTRSAPPSTGASQGLTPRSPVHRPIPHRPFSQDVSGKTASLPIQPNFVYQQQMAQYGQTHSGGYGSHPNTPPSQHWSPGHRPHPHPQLGSNQSSPQRILPLQQAGPQRHSVAYLPEQSAAGFQHNGGLPQSRSYQDYHGSGSSRSGSTTPTLVDEMGSRSRIDKMEEQLASLTAWVQTTGLMNPASGGSRPSSARSTSSIVSDASYSAKSKNSTTVTPMQSPVTGSRPGMSDVSSSTPQAIVPSEMAGSLRRLHQQARDLRQDCNRLRWLQQGNSDIMRDTIQATFQKIRDAVERTPGANDQPGGTARMGVTQLAQSYKDSARKVNKDLEDLESSVEELRSDVLNKRCRVNMAEVETMALALSNVSKALADLKGRFPALQEGMKTVMAGEMEVVVGEEKFLKDEPDRIESALKRCKKLTQTLYTMKRLASVQEQRPPTVPSVQSSQESLEQDRKLLLENIQAVVPNHQARVESLQQADVQRERKKKLATSSDHLRFEKHLELAQKQLKETNHVEENKQRQEKALTGLFQDSASKRLTPVIEDAASPAEDKKPAIRDSPDGAKTVLPIGDAAEAASPPDKPPRTMVYESNTGFSSEAVIVKSPVLVAPSNILTSSPSSSKASTTATSKIPMAGRPPAHVPSATSTPKSVTHVTFSTTVTEIKDVSGGKSKKIPPPPPPRKSSRTTVQKHSPTRTTPPWVASPASEESRPASATKTPTSPHNYENIQNFPQKSEGSPKKTGGKVKPLSKFQKDIAEGICANMNRPDLQEQRVNCAEVVREANLSDSGKEYRSSDDSENSSLDSQKNDTVKRKPRVMSKSGGGSSSGRKIPPPPPVRKTSALSSKNGEGGGKVEQSPQGTPLQEPSQIFPETPNSQKSAGLSNGDVKGHAPVNGSGPHTGTPHTGTPSNIPKPMGNKRFEETEIY